MPSIKRTITLNHDEVMEVLADYLSNSVGEPVEIDALHLRVTEGRINEGYTSGPDQKARIDEVSITF